MHPSTQSKPCWLWLFALALGGCGADPGSGAAGQGAALPPETNLLLVTLDTTRADRIGIYGQRAARTPNLDALAQSGVRFERAYAHVPLTLPSHASIMTGTLPPEHGIHDNGRRALGKQLVTLAEVFRERGHRTAAFVSAIALDSSFGLNRGFEVYDDASDEPSSGQGRVIHRRGDQTTQRALDWLRANSGPFFLWVHYYDPHAEYEPPPGFEMPDPYDGEIAFVDSQLGRLLGWIESQQLRDKTLVIAIGDHGESLGEKGEHTHASLIYDGTQHIPFLIAMPGTLPAGLVLDALAGQSDLFPTVMDLFDWAVPAQVSGRSLAPLLRGQSLPPGNIWLESEYAALNFGWSPLQGIVHGPWKYVQAPTPELYNLLEDPRELNDLAASQPEVAREMLERLRELRESMGSYSAPAGEARSGLAQELSALGYAQGLSGSNPGAKNSLINPIEHIDVLEQYHAAIGFSNRGEFERMLAPLESVTRAFPDAPGFRTQLGDVYRRLGRLKDAREHLEAALKLDPNYDPAYFYLAELERLEGHGPAAVAAYRRVLDLRPDYVPASERLAGLLVEMDQVAEALPIFEGLLAKDPSHARHWLALADLHARLAEPRERLICLERAAVLNSDDLGTQNLLAWVLATTPVDELRAGPRALQLAQSCVAQSHHEHPEPLLTLAAAQAELGQFEIALKTLREALELAQTSRTPEYVSLLRSYEQTLAAGKPLRDF